jgi:hypothetical protein
VSIAAQAKHDSKQRTRRTYAAVVTAVVLSVLSAQVSSSASGAHVAEPEHASRATVVSAVLHAHGAEHVIVLLKGSAGTSRDAQALSVESSAATAMAGKLQGLGASSIRPLTLINAVAAKVSVAAVRHLRTDPNVRAIVPDITIHEASNAFTSLRKLVGSGSARRRTDTALRSCNNTGVQLEPEALQLTNTAFDDASIPQAQSTVTGKGVTVAFLADGIDTNNIEFQRNSRFGVAGTPVFSEYQDFSGDTVNLPTSGGEAFGDASSIAAQGNGTYDLNKFVNRAYRSQTPCLIRIVGVAPGASLMGLKVFGEYGASYASSAVAAIGYAVFHKANVINESFGFYRFPDTSLDPIKIANDAAVKNGVTVVASSGDAGVTGTVGSPASDPDIITTGASTQLRAYEQSGMGASYLGGTGYVSNNISALSSAGPTYLGTKSVDIVAPGDLGWAACTASRFYADCQNFNGQQSPVQLFGGTSESSPLTAGEAALIIQAYRETHTGNTPSPALIKQIIMSSATDLGVPGYEQGAGLINCLAAVRTAESYRSSAPTATGGLLMSPNNLSATTTPGSTRKFTVSITNSGTAPTTVNPKLLTQGPAMDSQLFSLTIDKKTPNSYVTESGSRARYVRQNFTVPAGAQRLNATVSWNAWEQQSIVAISLFDPSGDLAAYSLPQGVSNSGRVDVRLPAAGTWQAVLVSEPGLQLPGEVVLSVASSKFVTAGTVLPSSVTVAPGATTSVTAQVTVPSAAGDFSGQIVYQAAGGASVAGATPFYIRALVPITHGIGHFWGAVPGGNGRGLAGTKIVTFQVPPGRAALQVNTTLGSPEYVDGILVGPDGLPADSGASIFTGRKSAQVSDKLSLFVRRPHAGVWRLILISDEVLTSTLTAVTFQGTVSFNGLKIGSRNVPDSANAVIRARHDRSAYVTVTNTTNSTRAFFIDARRAGYVTVSPPQLQLGSIPQFGLSEFLVPPETKTIATFGAALSPSVGIQEELQYYWTGSPDVAGGLLPAWLDYPFATASISGAELPIGDWTLATVQSGPFLKPLNVVDSLIQIYLRYRAFDAAVHTKTGDLWKAGLPIAPVENFHPLWLAPGQSGVIKVNFHPFDGHPHVVHGDLFVDSVPMFRNEFLLPIGTEMDAVPYTYRVVPSQR